MTRLLIAVKSRLVYPADEEAIARMERVVRELLADATGYDLQLLQQYAVELARCETSADEGAARLDEERRLWTNVDTAAVAAAAAATTRVKPPPPPVPAKPKRRGSYEAGAPPRIAPLTVSSSPSTSSTAAAASSATTSVVSTATPPTIVTPPATPPAAATAAAAASALEVWDTRPKAIVRPQPQVFITQRAPSPRPIDPDGRKSSKLPLPRYRQSAVGAPLPPSPSSTHELTKCVLQFFFSIVIAAFALQISNRRAKAAVRRSSSLGDRIRRARRCTAAALDERDVGGRGGIGESHERRRANEIDDARAFALCIQRSAAILAFSRSIEQLSR